MNDYYVYCYSHPITKVPFYIGLGRGLRKNYHLNKAINKPIPEQGEHKLNTIRKLLRDNLEPVITLIDSNLSRLEAVELEVFSIAFIGRRCFGAGTLTNLTAGGDGVTDLTPESRNKCNSVEARAKKSKALAGKSQAKELVLKRTYNQLGKARPQEVKSKISISLTGKPRTLESRHRQSIAQQKYSILATRNNSTILEYIDNEFIKSNKLKKESVINIARSEKTYDPPKFILKRNPQYKILIGLTLYIL